MHAFSYALNSGFLSPGVFFLLLIVVMIFSIYAQIRVSSAYKPQRPHSFAR